MAGTVQHSEDTHRTLQELQQHLVNQHNLTQRPFRGRIRVQWEAYHKELHARENLR